VNLSLEFYYEKFFVKYNRKCCDRAILNNFKNNLKEKKQEYNQEHHTQTASITYNSEIFYKLIYFAVNFYEINAWR